MIVLFLCHLSALPPPWQGRASIAEKANTGLAEVGRTLGEAGAQGDGKERHGERLPANSRPEKAGGESNHDDSNKGGTFAVSSLDMQEPDGYI